MQDDKQYEEYLILSKAAIAMLANFDVGKLADAFAKQLRDKDMGVLRRREVPKEEPNDK